MGEPEMQTGAQLSIDSRVCCSSMRLGNNAISVFGTVAINQLMVMGCYTAGLFNFNLFKIAMKNYLKALF